jgi:hypothetical protein
MSDEKDVRYCKLPVQVEIFILKKLQMGERIHHPISHLFTPPVVRPGVFYLPFDNYNFKPVEILV